ncbi:MAG: ligase-associated DNA damage response DEXH box helicase [Alphaproteobacteria bacterium]
MPPSAPPAAIPSVPSEAPPTGVPAPFAAWFAARGWRPHAHQLALLAAARDGESALLTAPTGGGKTLAGFLPSLAGLAARLAAGEGAATLGLDTLYVSPLKALAVDVRRNLEVPIAETGLPLVVETRTGDTPAGRRARQRARPPHFLLTTPESLELLLALPDAAALFAGLSAVVIDELHALADTKRGDMLALCLARLATLAPRARRTGLSATVAEPARLASWLSPAPDGGGVRLIEGGPGPAPRIEILDWEAELPWSGHMGTGALAQIHRHIREAGTTIVFVNTRAQAELIFHGLWRINTDNLPIALHHGSLAVEQRRKVEAAMAEGRLRAVVATSSLDLGVDWAAVDLVLQVGAPKGASRLLQRIGRSNHRLDRPSRAVLVPANRFEVLECRAATEAVAAGTLDGTAERPGALDVLAQHVCGMACAAPFAADDLYAEVRRAAPYRALPRRDFDDVLAFVAHGGYALARYPEFHRLKQDAAGRWSAATPAVVRRWRFNVGTIVEAPMVTVRLGRARVLGKVEEYFVQHLSPGDTFVFAGRVLRFEGLRETDVITSPGVAGESMQIPAWEGGRLPLTTQLADRVRALLAHPSRWKTLPAPVRQWLDMQRRRSLLPDSHGLLVETFPRNGRWWLVAYCFEGRNAHQTLGMLLTRRMERAGLAPMGFVATDYVLGVWGLREATDLNALFDEDMLGDDLEAWMADSSMLRRTFRTVAVIAGLIERRRPGEEKTRRQVTFNADLIYDVLRRHEPGHVLLRATRADAASGLTDIRRLAGMLARVKGRIRHRHLDRVSPLAVPVLLEIGRESVSGAAVDELLEEEADALIAEAMADPPQGELGL